MLNLPLKTLPFSSTCWLSKCGRDVVHATDCGVEVSIGFQVQASNNSRPFLIYKCLNYTGWGKSRFTVVSPWNWCGHCDAVSTVVWPRQDKFTRTTEFYGRKGMERPLSQGVNTPTPALTGFYCFSGHIILRMVLIYYAQVHSRWLPFTENKGEDAANYIKKEGYLQM